MSESCCILHIINTGGPGGAETVSVNLARHFHSTKWRSVVVMPGPDWMSEELESSGIQTLFVKDEGRMALPKYLWTLSLLARRYDVRLVQSHLFGPSVVGSILGIVHGIPVVGTLHGEGDLSPLERFRRAKFAILNHGADRLVFVSESLRQYFLSFGELDAARTQVIPNGIDVGRYVGTRNRTLRAELGAEDGHFLVGAVGNIRPAKGFDVLLRAAALLAAGRSDFRFVIVGQCESAHAQELIRLRDSLGLQGVVRFTGFRRDIPEIIASLDAYAVTSRTEGFSMSLVEAMATGVPALATRCGGPEQILDDNVTGLLVENGSAHAIAAAIEALSIDAPLRRRLGSAAQAVARSRFAVETQLAAYESLYRTALERPRRRDVGYEARTGPQ